MSNYNIIMMVQISCFLCVVALVATVNSVCVPPEYLVPGTTNCSEQCPHGSFGNHTAASCQQCMKCRICVP